MTNAELIQKIRAEIERMHQEAVLTAIGNETEWLRSRIGTLVDIMAFLDTLEESEKPVPKDLEEAAKECNSNLQLQEYFIKGGIWLKEQMLNEAVEAIISQCPGSNEIIFHNPITVHSWEFPWKFSAKGLNKGDKVKLIIVKED